MRVTKVFLHLYDYHNRYGYIIRKYSENKAPKENFHDILLKKINESKNHS